MQLYSQSQNLPEFINRNRFAVEYGISPQRVSCAIQYDKISYCEKRKKIRLNDSVTQIYIEKIVDERNQKEKKLKEEAEEKNKKKKEEKEETDEREERAHRREVELEQARHPESGSKSESGKDKSPASSAGEEELKQRIAQVKYQTVSIVLAEKMGKLIPSEFMFSFWEAIIGSLKSNFMSVDDRLSNDVCAICKTTDNKTVLKVKERITEEIMNSLSRVKMAAEKAAGLLEPPEKSS